MKNQINRKAILLSAFFTALLLTLTTGGYVLSRGWTTDSAAAADNAVNAEPVFQSLPAPLLEEQAAQPTAEDPAVAAAYQAQLEAAYAALDEAYTQIETLQTAQTQTTSFGSYDDHDGDHDGDHEEYEEHDDHEEREHSERIWKGSERDHDDD